jgi:hypothetical protein
MSRFLVFPLCVTLLVFYSTVSMAEAPSADQKTENYLRQCQLLGEASNAETPAEVKTETPAEEKAETPAEEKAEVKKGKPAFEAILIEKGGVLLPKGAFYIEPSLQYSHFSRHRMSISGFTILEAIIIGTLEVEDLKRDILQAALTTRYGITPTLEAEIKVPYIYRHDMGVRGPGTTDMFRWGVDDYALGDIEGAIYYHLIGARGSIPDIICNIRVKSTTGRDPYGLEKERTHNVDIYKELPTGNGHWGISGGLTAVKVSDPAVFLASLGYFWNLKRDVVNYGEIDPGDSIEYSLGIAYALSERLSLSTSYQQRFTLSTKQNGTKIPGTYINSAVLFLGTSYVLSKNNYVNISVGAGLTLDAPDIQLVVAIPIRLF